MIITVFKRLSNFIKVRSAIREANKMQKLTRKRYYVLKIFNKIRVYDRSHIDYLINEGILHQRLRSFAELQKICIYFTK